MIDQVLGHYRILQKIGSGGMGDVYRARDGRLDRDVAVKILRPASVADPDRLRRFEQEARAAAALNHPNIVAIYDIGSHQGSPYIVSEMLEGETLRQKLVSGALPIRSCTDYGRQIANGLVAAHEKRIIHRDLKPENLFITRDGQLKILDFGIAKLTAQEPEESSDLVSMTTQTKVGTVLGTVGYMSPEQLRGKKIDHRSDIFSLGAILYEMLTGTRAFHGETEVDTMMAVLNSEPQELTASRENIPLVFEQIVQRCLEKDPENRFQSARDLGFALSTVSGSTSKQIVVVKTRWAKARRYLPWAAVVALLVALGMALQIWLAPPHQPDYTQVTFENGTIYSARFRADGSIIYAASWNGQPLELYTSVEHSAQAQPIGMHSAYLLAISPSNEVAISLRWTHGARRDLTGGVLARSPLAGGTPREMLEDVRWADWSPSGELAVVHAIGGRSRLEYPIGNVLYETSGWVTNPRFSPQGDRIAFLDHPAPWDDRGTVAVVDLAKKMTTLTQTWESEDGLAWSPKGEIWFAASEKGQGNRSLWKVGLSGKPPHKVLNMAGGFTLQDISSKGEVLVTADKERLAMEWADATNEHQDLSWYDWSIAKDISPDGKWVLFEEGGEPVGATYAVAIRKTDGSPPIKLGEGSVGGLSPDGKWALAIPTSVPPHVMLYPVGPGQAKDIPLPQLSRLENGVGRFTPDGQHIIVDGIEPGRSESTYVVDISGAKPMRSITPDSIEANMPSPDGKYVVGAASSQPGEPRKLTLFPMDGGARRELPVNAPPYGAMQWSADSKALYVYKQGEMPLIIERLDIATGKLSPAREIKPGDRSGVVSVGPVMCNHTATECVYSDYQTFSVLYVINGLR